MFWLPIYFFLIRLFCLSFLYSLFQPLLSSVLPFLLLSILPLLPLSLPLLVRCSLCSFIYPSTSLPFNLSSRPLSLSLIFSSSSPLFLFTFSFLLLSILPHVPFSIYLLHLFPFLQSIVPLIHFFSLSSRPFSLTCFLCIPRQVHFLFPFAFVFPFLRLSVLHLVHFFPFLLLSIHPLAPFLSTFSPVFTCLLYTLYLIPFSIYPFVHFSLSFPCIGYRGRGGHACPSPVPSQQPAMDGMGQR